VRQRKSKNAPRDTGMPTASYLEESENLKFPFMGKHRPQY